MSSFRSEWAQSKPGQYLQLTKHWTMTAMKHITWKALGKKGPIGREPD